MIELDVVVQGAGRVTSAFELSASSRLLPGSSRPESSPGDVPGRACVVLRHKNSEYERRPAGHPSGRWIPFFPSLPSIGAWRGARRRGTRACGRRRNPHLRNARRFARVIEATELPLRRYGRLREFIKRTLRSLVAKRSRDEGQVVPGPGRPAIELRRQIVMKRPSEQPATARIPLLP